MKLLGDAVVFRSDDEWYEVEESGSKNATVRLLSRVLWSRTRHLPLFYPAVQGEGLLTLCFGVTIAP